MSLETKLVNTARRLLPNSLIEKLKVVKSHIWPLSISSPVIQIYINDGETTTNMGINNFYSILAPNVKTVSYLEVVFYDASGQIVFSISSNVNHLGTEFIDVKELLEMNDIKSEYGIVTVQLRPKSPRKAVYKRFGISTSHFFNFYNDNNGSVAMIHPSSIADPANVPSGPFLSNQLICTDKLHKIILYQCNPCLTPHKMTHSLIDLKSGLDVAKQECILPPLGAKKIIFDLNEVENLPRNIQLFLSALPSANSKPMLQRVYSDGRYSMSHS